MKSEFLCVLTFKEPYGRGAPLSCPLWLKATLCYKAPMEQTLLKHLGAIVRKNIGTLAVSFLLITLANVLLISNPLLMRYAIEHRLNPWVVAPVLVGVAFLSSFLRYMMRINFVKVSRTEEKEMRARIYKRISGQTMTFFDRHGIGELTSRLSADISSYRDVLGPGLLFPVYFLTTVIPGLIALFWLTPKLAWIVLIPIISVPLINAVLKGTVYNLSSRFQALLAEMSNFVQETFSGIRIVKGYHAEESLLKKFYAYCDQFLGLNIPLMSFQGLTAPFLTLITRLTTTVMVIVAGYLILTGHEVITIADFAAFMWIQSYIYFPVLILGWVLPMYQQGRASYNRIKGVYEEPIELEDGEGEDKIPLSADIEFHNLTFTYPHQKVPQINGLSLKLKGGDFIGLTGPAGGGKSTLFKLLNREYEIPRGMITIGGKDIHDYPLESFYQDIVTVEQIPFLFSKSIKENVGFGDETATQEEIERASSLADLHETVLSFEEGYETMVGEKGIMLSGGQKQRVAIARAFLVERSILLLDDIFSALDTATEAKIFKALKENYDGKTVIITTQRVSALEKMDEVVVISKGRVIQQGAPDELLKKEGYFKAMKELDSLSQ